VIDSPETGGVPGPRIYSSWNGVKVNAYISGGTITNESGLTFEIQNRLDDALLVSGTTIISGSTYQLPIELTNFFVTSPTLIANSWLWLEIKNAWANPEKLLITVVFCRY